MAQGFQKERGLVAERGVEAGGIDLHGLAQGCHRGRGVALLPKDLQRTVQGQAPIEGTRAAFAARCGISRSYVSRIEKKALGKLEEALRGRV